MVLRKVISFSTKEVENLLKYHILLKVFKKFIKGRHDVRVFFEKKLMSFRVSTEFLKTCFKKTRKVS